jgi:hypothetical protein
MLEGVRLLQTPSETVNVHSAVRIAALIRASLATRVPVPSTIHRLTSGLAKVGRLDRSRDRGIARTLSEGERATVVE